MHAGTKLPPSPNPKSPGRTRPRPGRAGRPGEALFLFSFASSSTTMIVAIVSPGNSFLPQFTGRLGGTKNPRRGARCFVERAEGRGHGGWSGGGPSQNAPPTFHAAAPVHQSSSGGGAIFGVGGNAPPMGQQQGPPTGHGGWTLPTEHRNKLWWWDARFFSQTVTTLAEDACWQSRNYVLIEYFGCLAGRRRWAAVLIDEVPKTVPFRGASPM